jgi:hypothetical protein
LKRSYDGISDEDFEQLREEPIEEKKVQSIKSNSKGGMLPEI